MLTKKSEHKADVLVGKNVDKRFAINSMVGAVKALNAVSYRKKNNQGKTGGYRNGITGSY